MDDSCVCPYSKEGVLNAVTDLRDHTLDCLTLRMDYRVHSRNKRGMNLSLTGIDVRELRMSGSS
ncbi:hypothetical protein DPMN_016176 [Dreissena polymorpha]|uniref:Uncharacterized protein n=1 Tax=Dreissena polymorpha TaxID=45954 RepID=A0A9D4S4C2_DREPO|nr:hypothetical protein DPMN_016176 [Dreissena polymorpha]